MKLAINDSKTIKQLQNDFNGSFPYLKIEFFSQPHVTGAGSEKKFLIDENKALSECRTTHYNAPLEITGAMTVSQLEKQFQNLYGLSVQVFRKSGKVWLETINTDYWTLEQHNELGEFTVKGNSEVGHQ